MAYYLAADFGGTVIKTRILDETGTFCSPIRTFPSHAAKDADTLLAHFTHVLNTALSDADDPQSVRFAGLAFPGPFDYEAGIPLMQNINKYDSLYGVNLLQFFTKQFKTMTFRFANDADLFGLGEYRFGEIVHPKRVMYLCIGTGLGSCFIEDGQLIKSRSDVPPRGWVFDTPFEGDIIDRRVSGSALRQMMDTIPSLRDLPDIKAAAERAVSGDPDAIMLYQTFGERFARAVTPFLDQFKPHMLVIGGQISKSMDLFGAQIHEACTSRQIKLHVCPDSADFAMKGVLCLF